MNCHPDCPATDPGDCRISTLRSSTTMIGWTPVFDGRGAMINSDPNTFTIEKTCDTCNARWVEECTGLATVVTTKQAPRQPPQPRE